MKINPQALNPLITQAGIAGKFRVDGDLIPAKIAFIPDDIEQTEGKGVEVNAGEIAIRYIPEGGKAKGTVVSPLTSDDVFITLKDDLLDYNMDVPAASTTVPGAISVLNRLYGMAASTLRSRREDPNLETKLAQEKDAQEAAKAAVDEARNRPVTPEQAQQAHQERLIRILARTVGVDEFDAVAQSSVERPKGLRLNSADLATIQQVTHAIEESLSELLNETGFAPDPAEISAILRHKARLYRENGLTITGEDARMAREAQVLRDKIHQIDPNHPEGKKNLAVRPKDEAPENEAAESREVVEARAKAVREAVATLSLRMNPTPEHRKAQMMDNETKDAVFAQLTTEPAVMGSSTFSAFAIDNAQARRAAMALRGKAAKGEWAEKAKANVGRILANGMDLYKYKMEIYKVGDADVALVNDQGGAYAYVWPTDTRADAEFNPAFEARLTEADLVTADQMESLQVIYQDLRVNNDAEADFGFGDDDEDMDLTEDNDGPTI